MEIIIRRISQRCSGVLRKNKKLRWIQFYILIRDEERERVGEIKNRSARYFQRPRRTLFFCVVFIWKCKISETAHCFFRKMLERWKDNQVSL